MCIGKRIQSYYLYTTLLTPQFCIQSATAINPTQRNRSPAAKADKIDVSPDQVINPPTVPLSKPFQAVSALTPHKFELHYTTGKVLGSGGFSTAVEATSKLRPDVIVAAKITKKKLLTADDVEGIKSEIRIMRELHHKNVVKYIDDFEDDENYYVCLELLKGGELFDRIVKKTAYSELDARNLFFTIVDTVRFLHSKNIVHCDLKPENLLMLNDTDDTAVKIADFGFAKESEGNTLRTLCGSPGYVAPEILMKKRYGTYIQCISALAMTAVLTVTTRMIELIYIV